MAHTPGQIRELLVRNFPLTFKGKGKVKLPLKIGIHDDIFKAWSGATMAEIKAGLADYTDGPLYLNSCQPGADRYDLNGRVAGQVTLGNHCHSMKRLKALAASWSGPITFEIKEHAMCGSSKPKSVTLQPPAISSNAFIPPAVEPSLMSAREAVAHMLNNLSYSSAETLLTARDAANVDFGKRQAAEAATNIQPRTLALLTELLSALQQGKKIDAIKIVRAGTGMGLKEAKDWVEGLQVAVPQTPVESDGYKADSYMVLTRHPSDYGASWNLNSTLSYLSDAKGTCESLARTASSGEEVMLVQVLGSTKPVFSMRQA
jgi:ribosomal protein L7/L12